MRGYGLRTASNALPAKDGTVADGISNGRDVSSVADCRPDTSRGRVRTSMQSAALIAFEPDTVLPAQLLGSYRLDASAMPERRLFLAVLEDAVITFQRYATSARRRGQRLFRETEEWIVSDDTCSACSFQNVCDVLGFDSQYLRQGLLAWRDRQRSANAVPVPYRHPFRRLSGSRTRAIGRPLGVSDPHRPRRRPR